MFAVAMVAQLYAISVLAESVGQGIDDVFSLWLSGLDSGAVYSPAEALAVVCIERAVGSFALCISSAGMASVVAIASSQGQRMVAHLKKVGVWH